MINLLNFNKTSALGFCAHYKILIAEDYDWARKHEQELVKEKVKEHFPTDTFEVTGVATVPEAEKIIKNHETRPDILLTDGNISNGDDITNPDGPELAKFAEENGVKKEHIAVVSNDTYYAKKAALANGYKFVDKLDFFLEPTLLDSFFKSIIKPN
ncbi:MAG: hypothetical protein WCG23_03505 [bacterium]